MKKVLSCISMALFMLAMFSCRSDNRTISLFFDTQGGDPIETIDVYVDDSAVDLPTPSREGAQFQYWSTEPDGTIPFDYDLLKTASEVIILYAIWLMDSYEITYVTHPELDDMQQTYSFGETLELPHMIIDDHIFIGWYWDDNFEQPFLELTMPARNLVLYARYANEENIDLDHVIMFEISERTEKKVDLDLFVRGHIGFIGYDLTIGYDLAVLSLVSYENGLPNFINTQRDGLVLLNYVDVANRITTDTLLLSLSFDLIGQLPTTITVTVKEIIDIDNDSNLFRVESHPIGLYIEP
jgi:hypothetical protein